MNDDWGNQDITEDIHEWSVDSVAEKPSQVIHIVVRKIKHLKWKSTYKSQ